MTPALTQDDMWHAVEARDSSLAGQFWLGVRSTGIFCRPGCPARTPMRKNVVFFTSLAEALRSGLRPCKRCHPLGERVDDAHVEMIGTACRTLLTSENTVTLETLATDAGLSTAHFQRLFRSIVGMSPAQFGRAAREQRLHAQLPMSDSVIGAALTAGYSSQAQVYADASTALGMTPGSFRNKGAGETIRYAVTQTFLGPTLIAATEKGICRLRFGDDDASMVADLMADFANATVAPADDGFASLVKATVAALGTPDTMRLPLDVRGTAFQMKVWHALRTIPYGNTMSYGSLAAAIGQPSASRAVASACGSNDIAVLIPCHRVVGKDGSLTGYRWGTERKRMLLEREKSDA